MYGVENLHCLMLFLTLFLMEQSSANENTKKEIDIEPFQNEGWMDDIPIIEISIENLSLEIEESNNSKSNEKFI